MGERREFLGDEIHLMASDITLLRKENELLKMENERKGEENRVLRAELTEMKIKYEDKVTEAVAIRTILEGVVLNVSTGLARYLERRTLKKEHDPVVVEDSPRGHPGYNTEEERERTAQILEERPRAQATQILTRQREPLEQQSRIAAPAARVPVARIIEDSEPPPAFLRPNDPRLDSRIPRNEFRSDDDNLRAMHDTIGKKEAR